MHTITFLFFSLLSSLSLGQTYPWLDHYAPSHSIEARISPPPGYVRSPALPGTYAAWLRGLPLKPGCPEVFLFDGRKKWNQQAHVAVLDLDVGRKDLQQCADAVIRLKAEYHYSRAEHEAITFRFTSGDPARWLSWMQGQRPTVQGSLVSWSQHQQADSSYANFRKYLSTVFTYAGSYSLSKELFPVVKPLDVQAGDVFIQGGFPGHAVLVVDVAWHPEKKTPVFLLAQSYMPAQEMHILRNPHRSDLSPWYEWSSGMLFTPEWSFPRGSLKRF